MEEVRKACSPIRFESWVILKRLTLEESEETGQQVTTSQIMEKAIAVLDRKKNKRKEKRK